MNERLYALQDTLGSVVAVVNSAGAVQERYAYSSYGAPFFLSAAFGMESGTVVDWETLLAAYRADSCTGLYMARSRFFHCALGVWLSRDRIGTRSRRELYEYCLSNPVAVIDPLGLSELSASDYLRRITKRYRDGIRNVDRLWQLSLQDYLVADPEDDWCWDCEDDMEELIEAFYDFVSSDDSPAYHGAGLTWGVHGGGDMSSVTHFFAGAAWEGFIEAGDFVQDIFELTHLDVWPANWGLQGDWMEDTAYAYVGADFSDLFDRWSEAECRAIVKKFAWGEVKLSDILGPAVPSKPGLMIGSFRGRARKRMKDLLGFEP